MRTNTRIVALATVAVASLASVPCLAEDAPPSTAAPATEAPAPAPAKKYSLPWSLRGPVAGTLARSDTAIAMQDHGTTIASMLTLSYKVVPDVAVFVRDAFVSNSPDGASSGQAIVNPLVGGMYTPEIGDGLRLPIFAGVTVPVGMGGGDSPDKNTYAAAASGVYARSAMDNALFAVNYLTPTVGLGLAKSFGDVSIQVEATLLELIRARGSAVEKDSSRTNSTYGFHVGWYVVSGLSLSAELRYQRWLSTPAAVDADSTKRDQLTAGGGVRYDLALGGGVKMRPGVSYFMPIDDPMKAAGYKIVVVDLPFVF